MEDDSCLLYFYVLYSHQTHPSTPNSATHHGLGGAIQLLHTTTKSHTTPRQYAEKYRLHGGRSSVYRAGSRHGIGSIFLCLLKITRSDKTCFETNTESRHAFVH